MPIVIVWYLCFILLLDSNEVTCNVQAMCDIILTLYTMYLIYVVLFTPVVDG